MWLLDISNALHGNDMLAIHAHKRCQTRINAGVVDLLRRRIPLTDNDGAGATAALRAAKLSASKSDAAEVLEQGDLGVDVVKINAGAIEEEAEGCFVEGSHVGEVC